LPGNGHPSERNQFLSSSNICNNFTFERVHSVAHASEENCALAIHISHCLSVTY
jgi:hypothetical protein